MKSTSFFKRHPKLSIVFFNLVLLLFIFILFEILLRIFTPNWLQYKMKMLNSGEFKGYGTDANWNIKYNNGEFYSLMPNSTFKIYHFEYENTVHANNLGGRSSVPDEILDTTQLIPFTGDSFIMGVGVEDTETVVSLAKKNMHYNLLNLGIAGTGMHVQRKVINARYNELGQPKVIIYGFWTGNDFDDIIKENEKELDSSSSLVKKPAGNNESVSTHGFWWKVNYYINHNRLLNKLYSLQLIKQKILNIKNKSSNTDPIDPFFLIINNQNTDYITQVKKYLDKEIEALSKEPYKSIIVIMPDKYEVMPDQRKNMLAYYNLDEKNIDISLPNKILKETLNKYKINYIDATECIARQGDAEKLFYVRDNHFTKSGQQVFFDCIADSLENTIQSLKAKN
jgi:hypothetical protein